MTTQRDGMKQMQLWLPQPDHHQLKILAAQQERTIQELIREAVSDYLRILQEHGETGPSQR